MNAQAQREVCLVTGAAGFIGSSLSEALVARGFQVIGIDAFVDYYPRAMKELNLARLRSMPAFQFIEADLRTTDLLELLEGVDYVFHQAAQAGVRTSWNTGFQSYMEHNILATHRLLEAACTCGVKRVIFASSSSVYGNITNKLAHEENSPQPISPYGMTKLAGEHLCRMYTIERDLPTIALRYFTVYGPRQRPDMAFHKFIRAILLHEPVIIYGDGKQSRDFTYITDIVAANLAAMHHGQAGRCYNLGGDSRATVNEVLDLLKSITEEQVRITYTVRQPGDPFYTAADTTAARKDLGFTPRVSLSEGLRMEVRWLVEVGDQSMHRIVPGLE